MIELNFDKEFRPAVVELNKYKEAVSSCPKKVRLVVAVERNNGYVFSKELDVFPDGEQDEYTLFIVERIIKTILWSAGGYKIFVAGSHKVFESIFEMYKHGGAREFDYDFMSRVYETDMQVIECTYDSIPKSKESSIKCSSKLNGKRIGFDAGGSDRKVSAIVNGETLYSNETVWFPKQQEDPNYHFKCIYDSMKEAIGKMGGDVDVIGVSSAGVIIDNKIMVSSLFIKVDNEKYGEYVKNIYKKVVEKLEWELGHKIAFAVANDGDVTALAGSIDINDGRLLGIAMGTSEAVGYVDKNKNLNGWLNELAFAPVDFNTNSLKDEWSGDYGVGCKYFSQDAVIKLAKMAKISIDYNLSLAEQLKEIQKLANNGDKTAIKIYEDIGIYLAYELAYYLEFYDIKHVLLLGRVVSGVGGDTILNTARKVLPEIVDRKIDISMPSEFVRRVGQSIAAASLI